jgi:ubiquinol-cytochrome c reductase cytochrome c subunit
VKSLSVRRRHPLAAFVVLALALALTGGFYAAFTSGSTANADTSSAASSQQLIAGKKLFISQCSSCHGMQGQGATGNGPSLIGVGAAAVDFQVGTGRMPAQQVGVQVQRKAVIDSQDEIDALAAYIASLGAGPAVPSANLYNPDGASLLTNDGKTLTTADGGVLFRTNCSDCHGFTGQGGALTDGKYAPPLTSTAPKYIYEAMLTGPQNMPMFADTVLPPAQKQAIIKYLTSLRTGGNPGGATLGGLGPVSEGLFFWIFGLGAMVAIAMWIGARTSKVSATRLAAYRAAHGQQSDEE